MVPAEGGNFLRRLRVLIIAHHHQVATDNNFPPLIWWQEIALVIHDPDTHLKCLAPTAREPLFFCIATDHQMLFRGKIGTEHRRFGLPEGLRHNRSENFQALLQLVDGHWGRRIDEMLQTAVVVFFDTRMGQQHIDCSGRQKQMRHPFTLDRFRDHLRIELWQDNLRSTVRHRQNGQHTRRMRHRGDDQMNRWLFRRHGGVERRHHGIPYTVGPKYAFGKAGRTAR